MRKKAQALLIVFFMVSLPTLTFGQVPFDFSDNFYRANGINPDKIFERIEDDSFGGVADTAPDENFSDVRNISITGGFDSGGAPIFYSVFGKVFPDTYTPDAAGLEAMTIANQFRAFIFPKKDGNPLAPGGPNRRQDNLFDTRNGYFDNDPLGNWRLVFVRYTDAATNTLFGRRELRVIAQRNGRDLDGTPVIKRIIEIDDLAAKGLIQLQMRAPDGSEGFPWVL